LGVKCRAKPRDYPVRCAAQYTCYDVATGARATTSAAPIFSPFDDTLGQALERGSRVAAGQGVPHAMGGGGIEPSAISACFFDSGAEPGTWAALLLDFSVMNQAPEGYYRDGVGSWAPAFIETNGVTYLGPAQSVSGGLYKSIGLPGGSNQAGEFDYDGDGLAELLLPVYSVEHANSGAVSYGVWTRRGGTVKPYAPAESLPHTIVSFSDEDGDGRPDLLLDPENGSPSLALS
jgi:hypothetical protein